MKENRKMLSEIPLEIRAEVALKEAVAKTIADHRRTGNPIVVWRNGRVVHIPPEQIEVMDYSKHISRDPEVCGGEPVIGGTRVTVRTILTSLAQGTSIEEIIEDFPTLTEQDVRAVIAFAAASADGYQTE